MFLNKGQYGVGCVIQVIVAPVPAQFRIKHVAQPVQNNRLRSTRDQTAVHPRIEIRAGAMCGHRPAGHDDDLPAHGFDRFHLRGIGRNQRVLSCQRCDVHMIRAGAAGHARFQRVRFRLAHRAFDQFARRVPVDAHAALGGVHGLCKAQSLIPEPVPERQCVVPVHRWPAHPGISFCEGIRHDMGRRKSCAGESALWRARHNRRARDLIPLQRACVGGQCQHDFCSLSCARPADQAPECHQCHRRHFRQAGRPGPGVRDYPRSF